MVPDTQMPVSSLGPNEGKENQLDRKEVYMIKKEHSEHRGKRRVGKAEKRRALYEKAPRRARVRRGRGRKSLNHVWTTLCLYVDLFWEIARASLNPRFPNLIDNCWPTRAEMALLWAVLFARIYDLNSSDTR